MASLKYLWQNRAVFPFFSKDNAKAWAKRIHSYPVLRRRNRERKSLIRQGGLIAETAELGNVDINGDKKNLTIGEFSFLGRVEIALHDRVTIQDYVCINDGVILLSASHDLMDPLWQHKKAPIVIESYAWVATGAIILPGVTIGRGAVVGAGAVVSKDVPPYGIAAGNPAVLLHKKRTEELRYNPCEFLAANRAWLFG
ncbi:acetyltransferase, CysE/LacA/LpxA/NodL family [Zunongwangia profunda SM-A87]|uniref:Acetyltransferase, CysE/LacA/LpxA/NodL family n=1 Tax=Zunongwangia profunda (strain DSM 18752 / CCTCC AB 206139 / SM-A87) TaxID=655815 RepID=D5BFG3_ZUNPS|nr:acetyltransferase [Zunongwangia profunda]ADF50907.1 acetyltransferase, CysE/LacA/LpxA/NodL family [Zunongwangia profunda SM-A87]